ncbi:MAG: hypothetical protein P8X66_08095 [Maritimibacter sp.]
MGVVGTRFLSTTFLMVPLALGGIFLTSGESTLLARSEGRAGLLNCIPEVAGSVAFDSIQVAAATAYDAPSGLAVVRQTTADTMPADTGSWISSPSVDLFDDSVSISIKLPAETGMSGSGKPIELHVQCHDNTSELRINWGEWLPSEGGYPYDTKNVIYRIVSGEAQSQNWILSEDHLSTILTDSSINILRAMTDSNAFIAQTAKPFREPMTAVFDTRGLTEAMLPLMATCNLELSPKG